MEGVFLSALVPLIRERIEGMECSGVGSPVRDGLGLVFDGGAIVLCGRPGNPGVWWSDGKGMPPPPSPVWEQHIKGAVAVEVLQQGADRVLEIHFRSRLLYGASDTRLILEATGRNANIVLVRRGDGRILVCQRRVTSRVSRFRTLAPGQEYVPPPPSGLGPGSWTSDPDLLDQLSKNPTAAVLYRGLEGVGPVTARAILREAEAGAQSAAEVAGRLEKALLEGRFQPWMGPEGPLPISLGPGTPIDDPLSGRILKELPTVREDRLSQLRDMLGGRLSYLRRRLDRVITALDGLVSPDDYRIWGNLLLTVENGSRKGLTEIGLTDWEGRDHVIPLKPSRTLRSNASRYFRKASNTGMEKSHLQSIKESTGREIANIEKTLEGADELDTGQLLELIRDLAHKSGSAAEQGRGLKAVVLSSGWRCFVGRNARQNEEVTFGMGRRGDIWFHARGIPGAHVVLKMDGRAGNPPAGIMLEAALLAARGSGVSSGVVPVDYTGVQYVSRMKKGKPGQVNYTREKTIFVDLDAK